jgi:hypothetical protein
MDANEREKIGIIRRLRAGTESSGGATTLIDANERKEVKISADYIDYANLGFGPSCAATTTRLFITYRLHPPQTAICG